MNITPLAKGTGTAGAELTSSSGRGLSTEKINRIKQLAAGITVSESDKTAPSDEERLESEKPQGHHPVIKMVTNRTVNRFGDALIQETQPTQEESQIEPKPD